MEYIQSVVQREYGEEFVLVTTDGLEIPDSHATQGLKFWKVPVEKYMRFLKVISASKVFSIAVNPMSKRKRACAEMDVANEPAVLGKLEDVSEMLSEMKAQVQDILTLKSDSTIPVALKVALRDAFKCRICLKLPVTPLVIMGKCCKTIIGCQMCTDTWYSGVDGLTKSCPNCRAERGYAETSHLLGLDELLVAINPLFSADDQD